MLLKGLDDHGLTFFTNLRSRKGQELSANARAAVVFPWIALHRQVIVDGAVEALDAAASDEYFASRPRGAQLGAGGQRAVAPGGVARRAGGGLPRPPRTATRTQVPRPEHWGGLRLRPDAVEFWQGRQDRLHDRLRFRHTVGEWIVERLAP